MYRCILLKNETSDFIEIFFMLSYILTHSGSKVGGETIEGKKGATEIPLITVQ